MGVCEHGHVPEDLVDNVRFRSVVRIFDVSKILSRAECFKRKGIQKLPLTEDSMSRLDRETSLVLEIIRQLCELRNPLINFE